MGNIIINGAGYAVPGYQVSGSPYSNGTLTPVAGGTMVELPGGVDLIINVQFGRAFSPFGYMNPSDAVNITPDNSANGGPALAAGINYPEEQHVPTQQKGYVDYIVHDDGFGSVVPWKIKYIIDNDFLVVDGNLNSLPGGDVDFVSSKGWAPRKVTITSTRWQMSSVGGAMATVGPFASPITVTIGNGVDPIEPIVVAYDGANIFITYE